MKTFNLFQEQLSSSYTDYKAPPVQAAHARSMGSASRMRQMGMNAVANDPKDDAADNISGTSGVRERQKMIVVLEFVPLFVALVLLWCVMSPLEIE